MLESFSNPSALADSMHELEMLALSDFKAMQTGLVSSGGVGTVLAALDSHDEDFEVQCGSLQLLRDAMCENSVMRDQVAASEGAKKVVNAIHVIDDNTDESTHEVSVAALKNACAIFRDLSCRVKGEEDVDKSGGVAALLKTIADHLEDAGKGWEDGKEGTKEGEREGAQRLANIVHFCNWPIELIELANKRMSRPCARSCIGNQKYPGNLSRCQCTVKNGCGAVQSGPCHADSRPHHRARGCRGLRRGNGALQGR